MWNPEKDPAIQKAVNNYLSKNGLSLPDKAVFEPVIDGVFVCVDDFPVLRIGLPPVSNYPVRETEYTSIYLSVPKVAAV